MPHLFPGGGLVEGPDHAAELLGRAVGRGRVGLGFGLAKGFGRHHQGEGQGLAVHGDGDVVAAGRGVVGRGDIAPPACRAADALDAAEVGLDGGGAAAHHAADLEGGHPALLDPLGRKGQLRRSLDGEPEGVPVIPRRPGRPFQAAARQDGPVGGLAETDVGHPHRQPPDRQLGLVFPVGGVEEGRIILHRAVEVGRVPHAVGGDAQGGVCSPFGQGDLRVGLIEDAQFFHRQGGRAVKGLVQHPAHQRHPPAAAVHRQGCPAKLGVGGGQAAAGGKSVAGRHHRPQQDGHPQRHPQQPQQDMPEDIQNDPHTDSSSFLPSAAKRKGRTERERNIPPVRPESIFARAWIPC